MPVSPRELRRAREGDEAFPPDCARKFKPERELAAGGFGTVWLATQRELDRPAAVKLLHGDALADREQRERFVNEARLTAKLASPHVVRVLDFGASDAGEPWIAYELCPGRSLRARLDEGPMDPRDALTIAAQMAEALAEAHGQGILHRDVKPENVLEFERGHYKLTDFGIAKWTQEASHTRTGIVLGTPAYLAPEAIAGESPSARSDVYALGVMLYEMLAGRLPFTDQNPVVLMERHLKMEPRPPSELRPALPARLDALVARAMAKKPGERYASAEEMRAALTEAAQRPRDTRGDTRPIVRERVAAAAPDAARGVPLPFAAAVARPRRASRPRRLRPAPHRPRRLPRPRPRPRRWTWRPRSAR
jgi:serine/threonine protein kinase